MVRDSHMTEIFVTECMELINRVKPIIANRLVENTLVSPFDPKFTNLVFKLFHSIKCSASFMHFDNLASVGYRTELLLDVLRYEKVSYNKRYLEIQLDALDYIENILEEVRDNGDDSETDCSRLLGDLKEITSDAKKHILTV